jgi:hypothetical protein
LRQGLRELGYIEGKNITIEYRFAQDKADRLRDLAAELVNLKVDLIVTGGPTATRAAQQATRTLPVVMAWGGDPIVARFVASLARPGGNIRLGGSESQYDPKDLDDGRVARALRIGLAASLEPAKAFGEMLALFDLQARPVLATAYAVHPERFPRGLPRRRRAPRLCWINPPKPPAAEETRGLAATRGGVLLLVHKNVIP